MRQAMIGRSILLSLAVVFCGSHDAVVAQPGLCHQQPRDAQSPARDASESPYYLNFETKSNDSKFKFTQGQTYVIKLSSTDYTRSFKEFMITVEDPGVDDNPYQFRHQEVDVGALKTLDNDGITQFSASCYGTVENKDLSDKKLVELHWVSPKSSQKGQRIRFRAMVAENSDVWFTGGRLSFTVEKDDSKAADTTPLQVNDDCQACSEARYEVVFKGLWSQGRHSYRYPSHPDSNKFGTMVGASHSPDFNMWMPNTRASKQLQSLAEDANTHPMEEDIIRNMSLVNGTRSLIKGKMHKHPHMAEPSHALFRVDPVHHLFSLAVPMKPSPDWFLGTYMFELCGPDNQWLKEYTLPLFPWDSGTMDGISYESPTTVTNPVDNVDRVALGSFSKESPFYQLNLNDLTPFAHLEVKKLEEYPLETCNDAGSDSQGRR